MMRLILFWLISVFMLFGCSKSPQKTGIDFSFAADERLFTAHAFMNMAGFDLEYRQEGMHPIRIEIRDKLRQRLSPQYLDSINIYYRNHIHSLGDYGTYAFTLSPPPEFKLQLDSASSSSWVAADVKQLPELNSLLREFYSKADISTLWAEYEPRLQEYHDRFAPFAEQAFNDLKEFLGVTELPSDMGKGKIITAYSPLMSYFNAFTVIVNNDVYIVNGPMDSEPSPSSYYHEAAHHFVDRAVNDNALLLERIQPLLHYAEEKNAGIAYAVMEESLVRAIQILLDEQLFSRTTEKTLEATNNEYRFGFILCPYFVENLPEFSATGKSFEEYFPELITGIDIDHEIQRLDKFLNNGN
ncbi:MAG: hypothetical protein ACMZ7B_02850 [Balneola sp.]